MAEIIPQEDDRVEWAIKTFRRKVYRSESNSQACGVSRCLSVCLSVPGGLHPGHSLMTSLFA